MRLRDSIRTIGQGMVRGLAGLGLLLGQAPAVAAPDAAPAGVTTEPRPAIWLLEDEDTRIYLFGTTHVFERGFRWRSERLDRVIREADELVMETADGEQVDDEAIAASMFMTKPVPILSRVSAERRERLRQLIEASDIPIEAWDLLHTWAAGFLVMGVQMMAAVREDGARELSGAEPELAEEFRKAGRPISAVETSQQQMNMFRDLSRPAQQASLESVIDAATAPESAGDAPDGDLVWASGNVEAIAAEMAALPPELYDALLTRRNRSWADWLVRRLERPGTVLFAVGAGHLAGRDSVQEMLAARGLTARRID